MVYGVPRKTSGQQSNRKFNLEENTKMLPKPRKKDTNNYGQKGQKSLVDQMSEIQ